MEGNQLEKNANFPQWENKSDHLPKIGLYVFDQKLERA